MLMWVNNSVSLKKNYPLQLYPCCPLKKQQLSILLSDAIISIFVKKYILFIDFSILGITC